MITKDETGTVFTGAPIGVIGDMQETPFECELAALLVRVLHLEIQASEIVPEAPLFGDGLGLDSIDALELALAISRDYGVELKSDHEHDRAMFASLRSLARHIELHRTK